VAAAQVGQGEQRLTAGGQVARRVPRSRRLSHNRVDNKRRAELDTSMPDG
jgi:hypothetical protein